jgi:hypothetical protein
MGLMMNPPTAVPAIEHSFSGVTTPPPSLHIDTEEQPDLWGALMRGEPRARYRTMLGRSAAP